MASSVFATIIIALCLAAKAVTAHTPFTECSDGSPAPKELRIEGCTVTPCIVYRGEDAIAEWDFEIPHDTDVLVPKVYAIVFGQRVTYDIGQDNACDSLTNAECPMDAGELVTNQLRMPVLAAYPRITLSVQMQLEDALGQVLSCFQTSIRVADRS